MLSFNEFLQSPAQRTARMAIASGLAALLVLMGAPSIKARYTALTAKQSSAKSLVKGLDELTVKRDALALRIAEQAKASSTFLANVGGPHSEADVDYWRRQMQAYSMMRKVGLTIVGRAKSQFSGATKITVAVSAGASSPQRVNQALDFLQLFGYLESFDGAVATVHIAKDHS